MEIEEDLCKDETYGRSLITIRVALMEVLWMLQYLDAQLLGPQFAKKMHSIFSAPLSSYTFVMARNLVTGPRLALI